MFIRDEIKLIAQNMKKHPEQWIVNPLNVFNKNLEFILIDGLLHFRELKGLTMNRLEKDFMYSVCMQLVRQSKEMKQKKLIRPFVV